MWTRDRHWMERTEQNRTKMTRGEWGHLSRAEWLKHKYSCKQTHSFFVTFEKRFMQWALRLCHRSSLRVYFRGPMREFGIFPLKLDRSFGNVSILFFYGSKGVQPLLPPTHWLSRRLSLYCPFCVFFSVLFRVFELFAVPVQRQQQSAVLLLFFFFFFSLPRPPTHFPLLLSLLSSAIPFSLKPLHTAFILLTAAQQQQQQHKASSLFLRLVASRRFFFLFRFSAFVLFRERWYATRHFYRFLDFDADFFRICLDYLTQIRSTLLWFCGYSSVVLILNI